MTYVFPETLHPLREHLRGLGCDVNAFATARQAAFMAQQLLCTRIKFPPHGQDMTSTLWLIQGSVPRSKKSELKPTEKSATGVAVPTRKSNSAEQPGRGKKSRSLPEYLTAFDPAGVASGYHVFADGACVPNPGPGGWGIVAYRDGIEIFSDSGGDAEATNNTMELTAILKAAQWAKQYPTIPISIWTDSQYVVNGVNDWRHGWKRNGWQRGGPNAEPKNRVLLNSNLWRAIDDELVDERAANIRVFWVKGHAGITGNERADELAEIARQSITGSNAPIDADLDAQYRAIMARSA